ncbi:hypothetical protein ACQPU1_14230 [Clostridium paraputrificum]|uniref:hypothetical protein n=1 Tax=Clostridium TaxID=1485 RepID=UPI003D34B556
MGNIRFAMKMLFEDIGQAIFYVVSMTFSITVIFNIFNVIYNEDFTGPNDEAYIVFSGIAFIILIVSLLFIAFANLYFIYGKTKELAIAVLSGRSVYKVGGILTVQNAVLGIIGITLGLILGFTTMPIVNKIAYMSLGRSGDTSAFSITGFTLTIAIIVLQFIMMILVDMGYVYRREIVDLIREKKIMYERDDRKLKVSNSLYINIYFLPLLILLLPISIRDKSILYNHGMIISLIGMVGIVRYALPKLIMKLKLKKYLYEKIKLQSLSNLHYSLRKANYLIVILVVSISLLIKIICQYNDEPQIRTVTIASYIVVTLLMAITIIYKVFIESINRKNSFKQLKLIGYKNEDIRKIILEEEIYFYGIILGIPLFHMIILLLTNIVAGNIDSGNAILLIGIYLGAYLLSFIISVIGYKKIIFDYLREEK